MDREVARRNNSFDCITSNVIGIAGKCAAHNIGGHKIKVHMKTSPSVYRLDDTARNQAQRASSAIATFSSSSK